MGNPTLLSEVQERLRAASRERWFRTITGRPNQPRISGFFDSYPRFFSTSSTASAPDRLNQRHRALIQSNSNSISGRTILDIASHDGRWSLAAHKAGAAYVLGIEARQHLIDSARTNMCEYQVPDGKVEFVRGDVMVELDKLQIGSFDTVFCFGFLYHTIDHMSLLRKVARLRPTSLIIDTFISGRPGSVIEVHEEATETESAAAVGDPGNPARAVKGYPSRGALELMLKAAGFSTFSYYDWRTAGIKRWDDLKAYYLGMRVTLRAVADPNPVMIARGIAS